MYNASTAHIAQKCSYKLMQAAIDTSQTQHMKSDKQKKNKTQQTQTEPEPENLSSFFLTPPTHTPTIHPACLAACLPAWLSSCQ